MACGIFYQVLVLGDGRPYCTALLLPVDPQLGEDAIDAAVIAANKNLPDYARVGGWLRLDSPICAEQGLLTENGRPRRDNIQAHFALQIDQLYFGQAETLSL